jgi:predicted nucleic acid-binding protein
MISAAFSRRVLPESFRNRIRVCDRAPFLLQLHLELDDCLIAATCVVNKATQITGNIKPYPMQGIEKKEVSVPS